MAFGSMRGFAYSDDIGTIYGVRLDESNTELVNSATPAAPAGSTAPPRDLRLRKIRLLAANGSTKSIVILSRTIFDAIDLGDTFAAPAIGEENPANTAFVVTQKLPERILRRVTSLDTGKNDGDIP